MDFVHHQLINNVDWLTIVTLSLLVPFDVQLKVGSRESTCGVK